MLPHTAILCLGHISEGRKEHIWCAFIQLQWGFAEISWQYNIVNNLERKVSFKTYLLFTQVKTMYYTLQSDKTEVNRIQPDREIHGEALMAHCRKSEETCSRDAHNWCMKWDFSLVFLNNPLLPACPSSWLKIFVFIEVIYPKNNLRLMYSVQIKLFMRLKLLNMSAYFLTEQCGFISEKKKIKDNLSNTINYDLLHCFFTHSLNQC